MKCARDNEIKVQIPVLRVSGGGAKKNQTSVSGVNGGGAKKNQKQRQRERESQAHSVNQLTVPAGEDKGFKVGDRVEVYVARQSDSG